MRVKNIQTMKSKSLGTLVMIGSLLAFGNPVIAEETRRYRSPEMRNLI